MHNLKEIRKDFSKFERDLEKRSVKIDFNNLKKLDELNRDLIQKKENLEKEKKNISKSKDEKMFLKSKENGYIYDVEILLLLLKHKIKLSELPVEWSHKSGSKVNVIIDSLIMLYHLFKLRFKFK